MRYEDCRLTMLANFAYSGADLGQSDPAEEFHEASKYSASTVASELHPARNYFLQHHDGHARVGRPSLMHVGDRVDLPRTAPLPTDLAQTMRRRRSGLTSSDGAASLDELAAVLSLSYGADRARDYRSCPSAGALYPFDLAVLPFQVSGLDQAMYVFDPFEHCLWRAHDIDGPAFLAGATVAGEVPRPAVVIALVATFARTRAKYGLRGYRFALLEAGHIAQNVLLVATALGLSTLPWGGYSDRFVDRALYLDGTYQSCLYLLAVGGQDD